MLKIPDFHAPYNPIVTKSKGMLKSPDFHATYDPIVTKSKGMLKSPDFHANQGSLIVSVVNFTFIVNNSALTIISC